MTTPDPHLFISNQRDLLKAMAKGGKLYQVRDGVTAKWQWWVKKKTYTIRVLLSTGDAARRKGYIEPTGLLYWKLTAEGKKAHNVHTDLGPPKRK